MTEANKNTWKEVLPMFGLFIGLYLVQYKFGEGLANMNWSAGLFLFIMFASLQAFIEATLDYLKMLAKKDYNGHVAYRILTGLFILSMSPWVNWQSIMCYIVMFSFIHDGVYYMRRNNLDSAIYLKGFWDFTDTPIAIFDKLGITKVIPRSIMFVAGLTVLIIFNYANK